MERDDNSDGDTPIDGHELKQVASLADNVSLPREILFVGILCTAQFTTQAGLGQILSTLHIVGSSLGITDAGVLSWFVAGYSLSAGSFILLGGRLGDIYGHKKCLILAYAWSALWALIAGVSYYSSYVLFIFARVMQGLGPAVCLPNGLALLGRSYPPGKRKDMIFAVFGATAPTGSVVGAIFGALFSQVAGFWPWTFFSFAITMAALAVAGQVAIPTPPADEHIAGLSSREKIRQLDLVGATLGITALILINFAWNQAGVVTWDQPYVYVLLIVGVLLLPIFFWWEKSRAVNPLVPFSLFTADMCFVLALIALGWGSFGVWIYYSWQFLLIIRELTPMLVSAMFLTCVVSGCTAAITTGVVLSRLRPAWVMTIALAGFLIGLILIGTAPVEQIFWAQTFVSFVITPFGMDMSFPAGTIIVSNSLPKHHQGMGASLINTVVNYSIALSLGFAGTIEANVADGNTLRGYRGAFYMGIGLAGAGLCLSLVFLARSYLSHSKGSSTDEQEK